MTQFWSYRQRWCSRGWWKNQRKETWESRMTVWNRIVFLLPWTVTWDRNKPIKSLYCWVVVAAAYYSTWPMISHKENCLQRVWEIKGVLKVCRFPFYRTSLHLDKRFLFSCILQLEQKNCWSLVFSYCFWKTHLENADLDDFYFL